MSKTRNKDDVKDAAALEAATENVLNNASAAGDSTPAETKEGGPGDEKPNAGETEPGGGEEKGKMAEKEHRNPAGETLKAAADWADVFGLVGWQLAALVKARDWQGDKLVSRAEFESALQAAASRRLG